MLRKIMMTIAAVAVMAAAPAAFAKGRVKGAGGGGGGKGVPEFSGEAAGSALALIGGGVLVLAGRRRPKEA